MVGLSLSTVVIAILDLQCRNRMEGDDDLHSPSMFVELDVNG